MSVKTTEKTVKYKSFVFSFKIARNNKEKIKNSTNVKIWAAKYSEQNIFFEIGLKNKSVMRPKEMYTESNLNSSDLVLLIE